MVIIRIKPILFSWKFEDLTLACKKCGSTKELRLKPHSMIRNLPEEMVLDRRPVPHQPASSNRAFAARIAETI
jgi:hypothetical protein